MRFLCIFALAYLLLVTSLIHADAAAEARLLREAAVPTDAAGLTRWIKNLLPATERRAKAETLIRQLGDDDFAAREKTTKGLLELGPSVLPLVRKATTSPSPEVRLRARKCVRILQSRLPGQTLVAAAVRRLEPVATAESAQTLLDLFCSVSEEIPLPAEPLELTGEALPLGNQVQSALVRLLQRSDKGVAVVRAALANPIPERRCAAAIVLVRAGAKDSLPEIRKLLKDTDGRVRLGVARILAQQKEKASVPVLIALVDRADACSALAEEFLYGLAGDNPPPLVAGATPEARRKRRDRWQAWWEKNKDRAEVFDSLGRWALNGFVERFSLPVKDITKGYRSFGYEATVPGGKAEVRDGRLMLRGDHEVGDQRLVLTARKVTGKAEWPDALDIAIKLGGTANDNIGWHVGLSVGRVKMLFHPNFPEGSFRVETADTHEHFHENQNMGFTPAADVLHPMTIRVRRTDRGYRFEVELVDANGGGKYRKTFEVSSKQMGRFDRIGLERSGRRGGDALFTSLSVKRGR